MSAGSDTRLRSLRRQRENRSLKFEMAARGARTPLAERQKRREERRKLFEESVDDFEVDKEAAINMLKNERVENKNRAKIRGQRVTKLLMDCGALQDDDDGSLASQKALRSRRNVLLYERDPSRVREKPVNDLPQMSPGACLRRPKELTAYRFPQGSPLSLKPRRADDDKENQAVDSPIQTKKRNSKLRQAPFSSERAAATAELALHGAFKVPARRFPGLPWEPPIICLLRAFSTASYNFPPSPSSSLDYAAQSKVPSLDHIDAPTTSEAQTFSLDSFKNHPDKFLTSPRLPASQEPSKSNLSQLQKFVPALTKFQIPVSNFPPFVRCPPRPKGLARFLVPVMCFPEENSSAGHQAGDAEGPGRFAINPNTFPPTTEHKDLQMFSVAPQRFPPSPLAMLKINPSVFPEPARLEFNE